MRTLRERLGSQVVLGLAFACFGIASLPAIAQTAPRTKEQSEHLIHSVKGADLFRAHCAACHGSDATGGGPLAPELKTKVADLTRWRKTIKGSFQLSASERLSWATTSWRRMAPGRCQCGVPYFIRLGRIRTLER